MTEDCGLKTADWKLETGNWTLETGDWKLETGNWRLETGDWRLETGDYYYNYNQLEKFSAEYWNRQYLESKTGWDIGYVSTPIKEYIDQLTDKSIKILVPGAGNAYEVEYLKSQGFSNTYLLDFSEQSIQNFLDRCHDFPVGQIIIEDFFDHHGSYDLIIEQTFFSSIPPHKRNRFTAHLSKLLNTDGKYVGLLFNHHFQFEGPPFGGTDEEYSTLFSKYFEIEIMETAYNSIKPRRGREFFLMLRKLD